MTTWGMNIYGDKITRTLNGLSDCRGQLIEKKLLIGLTQVQGEKGPDCLMDLDEGEKTMLVSIDEMYRDLVRRSAA